MRKHSKVALPFVAAVTLLILGTATVVSAGAPPPVPEIDPTTGVAALALMAGAVLIIRGRHKK